MSENPLLPVPRPAHLPSDADEPEARTIVVNGHRCAVRQPEVGYSEIVRLAFPYVDVRPDRDFTITYRGGPVRAQQGVLVDAIVVPIADEEIFNVVVTDRS